MRQGLHRLPLERPIYEIHDRIAELEALLEEERRKVSQLSKHPRPSFSLQLLSIIPS